MSDPRRQFVHLFVGPASRFQSLLGAAVKFCLLCGVVKRGDGVLTRCRGRVRIGLRA